MKDQSAKQQATMERERKLHDLKLKLVAMCCQSLLNPPLPFIGALRFDKDDTEEDKEIKRKEHARKAAEREEERIRREPELLRELEKIMERVRSARRYVITNDDVESFLLFSFALIMAVVFDWVILIICS